MKLQGAKINFLGDSITEGVGTSGDGYRFVDLIAQQTGALCRNYGISGTRIARQTMPSEDPSFDLDFPSRVAGMDADADAVVVFGGTNDFGHGDAPFGAFSDRTADTFCGGLHVLYSRLTERFPTAQLVVITPLHRQNEENPCGDNKPRPVAPLHQYVEMIRRTAEFYSIPVLDLYAGGGLQPQLACVRERYVPDGLHPNDAGHRILAQKIIRFLENM